MSSPPPIHFPSSENGDEQMQETVPGAPQPLFFTGTPVRGTPSRSQNLVTETPTRPGAVARRALGVTPHRSQLPPGSSPPIHFPASSSPVKTPARPREGDQPLFFPQSTPRRNRRGDIHSTAPSSSLPRRTTQPPRSNQQNEFPASSAPMHYPSSAPPSSAAQELSAAGVPTDNMIGVEAERVIWGTNVVLEESIESFRDFLHNFKPKYRISYDRERGSMRPALAGPEVADQPLYEDYLRRMRRTGQTNLNLDVLNLVSYPPTKKLFSQLIKYPQEIIPVMDQVLRDAMLNLAEEDWKENMPGMIGQEGEDELHEISNRVYKVRPWGDVSVNMRELNPSDTDKLVTLKGLVIRATPVIPDMKTAFFRCLACSHTVQVEIDRGRIAEPDRCPRDVCNSVGTMSIVHNRCDFADRQVVRLQETPDAVPDGQTPHTVSLCVYDELVDLCKPGDRLTVTGIFRAVPTRVNPRQRTIKALFRTYVDVVHIQKGSGGSRLGLDKSTRGGESRLPGIGGIEEDDAGLGEVFAAEETDERENQTRQEQLVEKLEALSKREDIYDVLASSLAPSIWEMDDVKKGILLQLFGGTNKSISRGGGGGGPRYRGDINVLLVGDPGTSKSQILKYVHKIAPRGVYTSGKGSSAVGLTAYVTRDPDSKQLVLESGALVLSDGGVCCIDEFDKMSDATRSVLHEVMEQQTVSIAKAGIITTLNARTSILAAANPVQSKYNVNWPITRNIDLPPTLISRFDLLYLVLDKIDETMDRRLARHLVGLYLDDTPDNTQLDIVPLETLSAYITHARSKIQPTLTEEASKELVSSYVELRSQGEDPRSSERRITATTRQLESMIRLSEAHARMRFSGTVELQDVQEANRLMREAMRSSATDPVTGLIDLDMINTGVGQQQRRTRGDLRKEFLNLLNSAAGNRGVKWVEAAKQLGQQSSVVVQPAEFQEVISALEREGIVKVIGERDKRMIRRVNDA